MTIIKNKCIKCNKEFESRRIDKKTCSEKCRKAIQRVPLNNVPLNQDKIVPDKTTDKIEKKIENRDVSESTDFEVQRVADLIKRKKVKEGYKETITKLNIYFCSEHQDHCETYCKAVCKDCHHILNEN